MYNLNSKNQTSENKQQEQLQVLLIIVIVGIGYYFLVHLSKKREETKEEINKLFQQNSSVTATDLNSEL
jgi:preprotein translocase subunit YajC